MIINDIFDIKDKVIIITGAAGNLGSKYAKVLSQAAFVLGYFVCTSMQAVDALCENWPEDEPEIN